MSERRPPPQNATEVRERLDEGTAALFEAIGRLSDEQLTGPRDAVGWNVRDHLVHLAVWAEGVAALLRREDRWAAMGLERPSDDEDALNAIIRERHQHLSAAEARDWVIAARERVRAAVAALSDAELAQPYERYVAPFTGDGGDPVGASIAGNTFGHYEEHLPWMLAIAEGRA